ncbi:MAG: haloalkane dehalogenase [Parvibaculum sp.]|nr:haloalkane dehalogenase [Parvibaculum sp.]
MTTASLAISTRELPKKSVTISGRSMAYSEMGPKDKNADPIVFLHGNPTSSYLWRNVMPHLKDQGRCIAPDLIGMGDSDKLEPSGPERYTFREHRRFLDSFLEVMGIEKNVTLVIHDWGSALGFDWANRNRTKVKGIAYMEGIVRPLTWDEWSPAARRIFEGFRSDEGEKMILEKNLFIEAVLPGSILRKLSDEEMEVYRRPFKEAGEDRRPTLSWPRQIPLDGTPADVVELVQSYADWMTANDLPKLFINADPGAILIGAQREFCRSWKNQTEVTVKGNHFLQEDSPHEIGEAIARWHQTFT